MKVSLVAIVCSILLVVGVSISAESRYTPRLKTCHQFESNGQRRCQKSGFLFLWHFTCSFKCSDQGELFLSCTKVFGIRSDESKCADIVCVKVKTGNKSSRIIQPMLSSSTSTESIKPSTSKPSSTKITTKSIKLSTSTPSSTNITTESMKPSTSEPSSTSITTKSIKLSTSTPSSTNITIESIKSSTSEPSSTNNTTEPIRG